MFLQVQVLFVTLSLYALIIFWHEDCFLNEKFIFVTINNRIQV
jgi:hypothetical protein